MLETGAQHLVRLVLSYRHMDRRDTFARYMLEALSWQRQRQVVKDVLDTDSWERHLLRHVLLSDIYGCTSYK
jgi:hypothetical protein